MNKITTKNSTGQKFPGQFCSNVQTEYDQPNLKIPEKKREMDTSVMCEFMKTDH